MVYTLTAALIVVCLLNGIFLDQSHRRLARASGRWVDALVGQQQRHAEQTEKLLQRIQAPHAAVAEHHATLETLPEPVSPLPMSDKEMADMQEREQLIKWMEAVENGEPIEEPVQ